MRRSVVPLAVLLTLTLGSFSPTGVRSDETAQSPVAAPARVLGFEPGEDRKLASWDQVVHYFRQLDAASDRVLVQQLGQTTLNRPFIAVIISAPENLQRLDHFRQIQQRLADPRSIATEQEAEKLIAEGKTIVLITFGIHSTEVGSTLSSLSIAYRLAAQNTPPIQEILRHCIILLVPSLNPDGVDIVKQWYDRTLGTPYEGTSPPQLYHHYAGHDNNRDWYAFTQVETQLTVDHLYNVWHPQIVHDVHQMGSTGARMFVPPYIDPIEPNVDPLIVQGINFMGTSMAWELTAQGLPGIVINAIYDAWTPARAYAHYHGGIRILSETASARLATPITLSPHQLEPGRNYDARQASWNFPLPWPGGQWHLRDIVRYMQAGVMALLGNAARHREYWLRNFYMLGQKALARHPGKPYALAITEDRDTNPVGRAALVDILLRGGVEIHRVREYFDPVGPRLPPGTLLVFLHQPYGAFAKTLLERQRYPDLRLYPGGPPKPPYDVTAHTLPLLMGVPVLTIEESLSGQFVQISQPPIVDRRRLLPAKLGRVGIYQSYWPSPDEGWTRWVFDQYKIAYTVLHDADIRRGHLRSQVDVIIIPDHSPEAIFRGLPEGRYPPEYVGGLGAAGVTALRQFVEAGGRLVALNRASDFAIEHLGLPVRNVLRGLKESSFYCPGSILRTHLDTTHPLAQGLPSESIAWVEGGGAFETLGQTQDVHVIARYGDGNPLLSGWLLGPEYLANKPALVEVKVGRGRAILFGFRPQYRGQSVATFPLLFQALAQGTK